MLETIARDVDRASETQNPDATEVDAAEMIRRAEALIPEIAARAAEAERLRKIPDATMASLDEAGLFAMLAPKKWGGYELGLDAFVGVTRALARACPSTAWSASFLIEHNWMISRFSEQAQREAFGDKPYVLAASTAQSGADNSVERIAGGYRVSGTWGFGSGVMHSDWSIVSGVCDGQHLHMLIPMSECTIDDVWFMTGMKATGSNTIVAKELFVPDHRVVFRERYLSENAPGVQLHPEFDLLRYEFTSLTNLGLAPIAVGAAEACLEHFAARMSKRVVRRHTITNRVLQQDSPLHVAEYGKALGKLHIAQRMLETSLAQTIDTYRKVDALSVEDRTLLRLDMANAAHLAGEVIEIVCRISGGGAYHESSPYQRYRRDIDVLLGHHINDLLFVNEAAGEIMLGLVEPDMKF